MRLDPSLSVGERAELHAMRARRACFAALYSLATVVLVSCARPVVSAAYDPDTLLAARLDFDDETTGRIVARSYLVNGRPVRLEVDADTDGRVDRWEYYRADGTLLRLGTSSRHDGREDTWAVQAGRSIRVEISTRRDGFIDRREFHERGELVRTEQDSNFDGLPDQWQQFENGKLRTLLLDTGLGRGKPDRRLDYDPDGSVTNVNIDPDGDAR
jgi:hypothetical protein